MNQALQEALSQLESRIAQRKLYRHRPYGHPETLCPDGELWKQKHEQGEWCEWSNKPWQYDFHEAGKDNQERLVVCGNRVGKSESGGYEVAIHMTGDYPDDWKGIRFDKPPLIWTGSPTNETSRDIIQKALLGGTSKEELGTGFIPKERLHERPKMRQAGCSDVVDLFKVSHSSGGVATCVMKTYEQGWRKWQGTAPQVVWLDEEPDDYRIYTEALTRLLTSHGIMMVTFTPLLGQTELVRHFQHSDNEGVWIGTATWEDAPHLLKEERERMMRSYPRHELQARTMGVPMMGEGAVFTTPEEDVVCDPFEIPHYFARINGIDFGLDHPFGCAKLAIDRDRDIIYLYDDYRKKGEINLAFHAEKIRNPNPWIPVAWPHDGAKRSPGAGDKESLSLKNKMKGLGVNVLNKSARYKNDRGGPQPVWPIIEELSERERTGRFKVFSTCNYYLEERRNYHQKITKSGDSELNQRRDDTLKACFYGVMMRRYAKTFHSKAVKRPTTSCFSTRVQYAMD